MQVTHQRCKIFFLFLIFLSNKKLMKSIESISIIISYLHREHLFEAKSSGSFSNYCPLARQCIWTMAYLWYCLMCITFMGYNILLSASDVWEIFYYSCGSSYLSKRHTTLDCTEKSTKTGFALWKAFAQLLILSHIAEYINWFCGSFQVWICCMCSLQKYEQTYVQRGEHQRQNKEITMSSLA